MSERDDIDALAGEYVLGTLDVAERRAVDARRLREPALATRHCRLGAPAGVDAGRSLACCAAEGAVRPDRSRDRPRRDRCSPTPRQCHTTRAQRPPLALGDGGDVGAGGLACSVRRIPRSGAATATAEFRRRVRRQRRPAEVHADDRPRLARTHHSPDRRRATAGPHLSALDRVRPHWSCTALARCARRWLDCAAAPHRSRTTTRTCCARRPSASASSRPAVRRRDARAPEHSMPSWCRPVPRGKRHIAVRTRHSSGNSTTSSILRR